MPDAPAKSRTEIFTARLDAHLAMLPEESRLGFLLDQFTTWQTRYGRFIYCVDRGLKVPPDLGGETATAYDFIETLAEISKRTPSPTHPEYEAQLAAVREAVA